MNRERRERRRVGEGNELNERGVNCAPRRARRPTAFFAAASGSFGRTLAPSLTFKEKYGETFFMYHTCVFS